MVQVASTTYGKVLKMIQVKCTYVCATGYNSMVSTFTTINQVVEGLLNLIQRGHLGVPEGNKICGIDGNKIIMKPLVSFFLFLWSR